jgi:hypothetical protein
MPGFRQPPRAPVPRPPPLISPSGNTGKSGTAGVFGAGVGWRVAPNFSLRADYEYFGGVMHAVGNMEADYGYGALSLSAQVRF